MAITRTSSTANVRFQDPEGVVFIPWTNSSTLGDDGYDVHDIVGDTFSLTQEDAERNEIPWEFGDDPLDENVAMGNKTVTMQCLDFQDVIMLNLFGCSQDGDNIIFPKEYEDLYCAVVFSFSDRALVMPKVKMDSKVVFESLRSDIARGELSGTLYSTELKSGKETPLAFVANTKNIIFGGKKITINDPHGTGDLITIEADTTA